ncbi:response regulator transcription factor [Oryzifoliimicrobium ureilyticus]|uniref:response regulator transcription factor n=1 Tax=Oryzifoliimicrobium ureilyticus TaxID=3113724 RepID=UPI0030760CA2
MRVLLVEDNAKLATVIKDIFCSHGFTADWMSTASDAEEAASTIHYDAIILDLGLPDRDGLDLIDPIRKISPATPLMVLTARDASNAIIEALDKGADDYLAKPFVMGVLIARLRALLRRGAIVKDAVIKIGNVELDPARHSAKIQNTELSLTRREYAALELFLRRANRVMSKAEVEESLYGFGDEIGSNAIEVLIHRLRKKLDLGGASLEIHNMRGIGYMLSDRHQ